MFSVLVIRLRSLRLLRVSGIVMRLRMFLLLITFLKASHSFRNRSEERFSRNAETDLVCRLLLEKKKHDLLHRVDLVEMHAPANQRDRSAREAAQVSLARVA